MRATVMLLLCAAAAHAQTNDDANPDCYRGPPHSAPMCPHPLPEGRQYQPVLGPISGRVYGEKQTPIVCREEQLMWLDRNGCTQYCRLATRCDQT